MDMPTVRRHSKSGLVLALAIWVLISAGCGSRASQHASASSPKGNKRVPARGGLGGTNSAPTDLTSPGIVCKGLGHRVAVTPTAKDFKRLHQEARRAASHGVITKMPTQLELHRSPTGKLSGTCAYGPGGQSVFGGLDDL
jgi:hypothetical protein